MGSGGTAAGKRQGGSLWDMVPKGWRAQKSFGNSSGLEENSVERKLGDLTGRGLSQRSKSISKGNKKISQQRGC